MAKWHRRALDFRVRTPDQKKHSESYHVSPQRLLLYRAAGSWLWASVALFYGWGASDWSSMPAPVFLTNWGVWAEFWYFQLAIYISWCHLRDEDVADWVYSLAWYGFELVVTLAPAISAGYWTLVFPTESRLHFDSIFAHGFNSVLIWGELYLNRLSLRTPHLPVVLAYPFTWAFTQLLWVKTGHDPDYEVLTFDEWLTVWVLIGTSTFMVGIFFATQFVARRRDAAHGAAEASEDDVRRASSELLSSLDPEGEDVEDGAGGAYVAF